jgi:hypothetical protein
MKTMILSKKSYDWKVLQLWCRIFAWLIINPHSTIIYFNLRLSLDSEPHQTRQATTTPALMRSFDVYHGGVGLAGNKQRVGLTGAKCLIELSLSQEGYPCEYVLTIPAPEDLGPYTAQHSSSHLPAKVDVDLLAVSKGTYRLKVTANEFTDRIELTFTNK